jgi:segregation and condensation protein B
VTEQHNLTDADTTPEAADDVTNPAANSAPEHSADAAAASEGHTTEAGEDFAPESTSNPPQTDARDAPSVDSGDSASGEAGDSTSGEGEPAAGTGRGGVLGDEDYLPPGQTEVPVGDEVVIDDETMRRALEAILMVTDEPLPVLTLARAVGRPTGDVSAALAALSEEYTEQGRGFDLREVGGGWRYYTRVEAAPYVERFVLDGQQARLTQAALETLAVVAYKQPVSRARVSAIRGVNVDGVMRTLVARGLVEEAGADTESQATLYRTTSYFLERMGMQSLEDLPELAPYLPEMDDIEEELAAQTIPAAPSDEGAPEGTPTEQSTDPQPTAEQPRENLGSDDAPAEDEAGDDTGIDGDLSTDEPVELDLEHEAGELEPSDEVGPTAQGDRDG